LRNRQLNDSYQHLFDNSVELIKKDKELQEIKKKEKYATSLLSDETNTLLYDNLLKLIEQERMYLNNKLTIEDVAKKLNTNRTYLSQIINEKTNTNFNNFINKYRIQEAQICLLNDEIKSYNIEGIAQSVGFSSKSTFNGAFKKYTGLTPSEYIQMKKEQMQGQVNS
jgi:YesN/AraC family two-component response regulator